MPVQAISGQVCFGHQRWAVDLGRIGLGLGDPGEKQQGDVACREQGSDGDSFEETHSWLLTRRRGLCGSVVDTREPRLASPLLR